MTPRYIGGESWTEPAAQVIQGYLDRWARAAATDDAREIGALMGELWDRLVMDPDTAEVPRGVAWVGAHIVGVMEAAAEQSVPEVFRALGRVFTQVLSGERSTFEIHNASGERRLLTFENGERTMTAQNGSPPLPN